ncbi:(2,3-dihydroxybenzoyl)adenylate synthase [Streptomyces polychromogenes]|uniref:(2,3-dihydroxybenzoyl)adenylate synthase n=1 Tax=Streptomyces polychromogenes TaxID=67342 RepID=A0ABN0UZV9_9ACTN
MTSLLDGCTPWPEEFVDHYWASGHWRGNTLDNLLRGWALQYGPRTALVHGDTRLTYAQLNRRADRMAAGFRGRGLRPGMRVVVQLPNVPEFVVTAFALMRAGLVPVFCPPSCREPEVPELVRAAQAVGYVGPSTYRGFDHTAMAADIAARWPFLRRVFTYEAPGTESPYGGLTTDPSNCQYAPLGSLDAPPEPALPLGAGQVAFLLVADGTVLVPRTHDDFAYQATAAAALLSLTEEDVYLAALPAASDLVLGSPGIIGTLSAGGTVVLADGPDPAACLPLLDRERVTVTALTTEAAAHWLDAGPAPAALRLAQLTGTPPDRATAERLGAALGCRVQQVFGTPEGFLTLTRPCDPGADALATHGRPLSPDDQIRLVDAGGDPVPDGTTGELLARGPHTVRGYYRAPDRDARSFTPDGYLRTGRLAHRTPDGDLVVTGRRAGRA